MNSFDEAAALTPLFMQCGYRSKVCTNHRATKLDGTPHKLCEFHRRKANANQQRLHKRQREERASKQLRESIEKEFEISEDYATKKARWDMEFADPMMHWPGSVLQHDFPGDASGLTLPQMRSQDMDILELLLVDVQSLPPLESFLPNAPPVSESDEELVMM
ncbi:uncharacterized protein IUM83_11826 [Phytophthora cinnamomi]|uniref:uncharacterized protein n=1 Tax=Phytophthora cinnamomi TaxID=4785 RepID=UPI002A2FE39C|nr:hypothetical protein IUM83_11826 [Phytophthora cinnamomi]KAJ8523608.1 hypothetical protein ON010_g17510 [Phytophthora cinnamomi]